MGKFKDGMLGGKESIKLGAGLLNAASKELAVERMNIEYIDMDLIDANSKNKYSIENIDELAQMIKLSGGIQQPLIIREKEDGRYTLTTGERRWMAAKLLRNRNEWSYQNMVPCIVKNPEDVDLPLSDDLKETFSILVTNQYRQKTDGDILLEIREWKKIFDELRAQGVEVMPAKIGEDGQKIKGERTRTLVAEQMALSPAQVGRFEKVEKQGSAELVQAVLDNNISISTAETVLDMPKAEQDRIINTTEQITTTEAKRRKDVIQETVTINEKIFMEDLKSISEKIKGKEINFTTSQYDKYQKYIKQLEKIFQL